MRPFLASTPGQRFVVESTPGVGVVVVLPFQFSAGVALDCLAAVNGHYGLTLTPGISRKLKNEFASPTRRPPPCLKAGAAQAVKHPRIHEPITSSIFSVVHLRSSEPWGSDPGL